MSSSVAESLKQMGDSLLHEKIKSLAAEERHLTGLVLEHIAEVDRRQLYIPMAYSSLFDYLTKAIGYSAGSAQRRIDAARLLRKVPEVLVEFESGAIHLSQISKLQRACRQVKKESSLIVETSMQKEIIEKLKNKNNDETDLILAQELNIKIVKDDKTRTQRNESVRVELTFSKEEMVLIRRAQDLLSHKTGGGLKETIVEMAKKVVKATEPKTRVKTVVVPVKSVGKTACAENDNFAATVAVREIELWGSPVPRSQTTNVKTVGLDSQLIDGHGMV